METTTEGKTLHENAREYYGQTLSSTQDLKTNACCSTESIPALHKKLLANIEDEVLAKFYGCGSPLPAGMEGMTVLDLGCGTGRDVYLAAQLVGPKGRVIGLDMTDEQLSVARKYEDAQRERFGFEESNVEFRKGLIEDLAAAGLEDNSVDIVISNCVINLAPDKEKVFSEIFRVLKPGGELYFSDVFSTRRVPEALRQDPVLHGECISGALYTEDFRRMLQKIGCPDYRIVNSRPLEIGSAELQAKVGNIEFLSITFRAFKIASLEDRCEDYGQVATYLGNLEESPHAFMLDEHHLFEAGRPMLVCGNSAAMVSETRFAPYFKVTGDRSVHFGLFDCEPASSSADDSQGSCC